jgi:serine/threonine protein kinase HipA of HipAB toxin-antitoxin module
MNHDTSHTEHAQRVTRLRQLLAHAAKDARTYAGIFPDTPAANDDAAQHDIFSVAKRISRIAELPLSAVSRLTTDLDHRGPLETLPVGELFAALERAETFGEVCA